jgi:ketosteroid isomerase-like protein
MSQANLAVVRAIHEAVARGEAPARIGLLHPDIEDVNPPGAVEAGTLRGIAAFQSALLSIEDAFEDIEIEVRDMKAVGEQVVVLATYRARGRSSGAQRENDDGYVWTVRDGKAVRFAWFNDPAEALAAVGLAE